MTKILALTGLSSLVLSGCFGGQPTTADCMDPVTNSEGIQVCPGDASSDDGSNGDTGDSTPVPTADDLDGDGNLDDLENGTGDRIVPAGSDLFLHEEIASTLNLAELFFVGRGMGEADGWCSEQIIVERFNDHFIVVTFPAYVANDDLGYVYGNIRWMPDGTCDDDGGQAYWGYLDHLYGIDPAVCPNPEDEYRKAILLNRDSDNELVNPFDCVAGIGEGDTGNDPDDTNEDEDTGDTNEDEDTGDTNEDEDTDTDENGCSSGESLFSARYNLNSTSGSGSAYLELTSAAVSDGASKSVADSVSVTWSSAGGTLTLSDTADWDAEWIDSDTVELSYENCYSDAAAFYATGYSGGEYSCECTEATCDEDDVEFNGTWDFYQDDDKMSEGIYVKAGDAGCEIEGR